MTIARVIQETSLYSWIVVEPLRGERQLEVFNAMARFDRPVTAREICYALGHRDMNYVRPRITELYKQGRVRITGKTVDQYSKRTVLLFEIIKKL